MSEYMVRAPGRVYVSYCNDKDKITDVAAIYKWDTNRLDAHNTARRIVALLNAFEDVSTDDLERGLFSVVSQQDVEAR